MRLDQPDLQFVHYTNTPSSTAAQGILGRAAAPPRDGLPHPVGLGILPQLRESCDIVARDTIRTSFLAFYLPREGFYLSVGEFLRVDLAGSSVSSPLRSDGSGVIFFLSFFFRFFSFVFPKLGGSNLEFLEIVNPTMTARGASLCSPSGYRRLFVVSKATHHAAERKARREHSDAGDRPAAFSFEFQYWVHFLQCTYLNSS